MFNFKSTLGGVFLLIAAGVSQASSVVVDTGPACTQNCSGGWSLNADAAYAGQVNLLTRTTINAIYPMIGGVSESGTTGLRVSIYDDQADAPGSIVFQQVSSLPAPSSATWIGVSDLTWELESGKYWVVIDVTPGGDFDSVLTGDYWAESGYSSTPNPLALYASKWKSDVWQLAAAGELNFALRVYGEVSAVPESSVPLMFSVGLLGVIAATGRRNSSGTAYLGRYL